MHTTKLLPHSPSQSRTATRSSWSEWSAYAAGIWSAVYACLGLLWANGYPGFPFGSGVSGTAASSLWYRADAEVGGAVIALTGMLGVLVALLIARGRGVQVQLPQLAFAWSASVTLLVLVPDARALVAVAYAPVFVLGAPFGWPPVSYSKAIPWPVINQLLCIVGGLLWGATALGHGRRTRGACAACGRSNDERGWTSPQSAAHWGRWATYAAMAIPIGYATTRFAWALGLPLGISEAFLREGRAAGMWTAGAALGAVAVAGALLTFGLIRPWGEVFPRWIPAIGGKRVPLATAIAPAAFVAALVTSAGFGVVRSVAATGLKGGWGARGPGLLWPLWGLALGVATLAYYYRRRGPCSECGRG